MLIFLKSCLVGLCSSKLIIFMLLCCEKNPGWNGLKSSEFMSNQCCLRGTGKRSPYSLRDFGQVGVQSIIKIHVVIIVRNKEGIASCPIILFNSVFVIRSFI